MTMKLTENSQKLLKILAVTCDLCNACDILLQNQEGSRDEKQKVYDLKRAAAEFSHQLLQFMGVEGGERQKEKLTKDVLLRANR